MNSLSTCGIDKIFISLSGIYKLYILCIDNISTYDVENNQNTYFTKLLYFTVKIYKWIHPNSLSIPNQNKKAKNESEDDTIAYTKMHRKQATSK